MSTGDLRNNLRKLQASVKGINYPKDVDLDGLSKGKVEALLPLYHYSFLDYSRPLAEQITKINVELYGKADDRFIEGMYKVLRELFSYKPPITKDQFFSPSFAEIKIIMCTEILQMIRHRHRELAPKQSKSKTSGINPGASSSLNQGPKIAVAAVRSTSTSHHSSTEPSMNSLAKSTARVVKEKKSSVSTTPQVPEAPFASNDAYNNDYNPSAYEAIRSRPPGHVTRNVTFRSDLEQQEEESVGAGAVEVISMDAEDGDGGVVRPIDMIPKTPGGAGPRSRVISAGVVRHTVDSGTEVQAVLCKVSKSLQELTERFVGLENRLSVVEGLLAVSTKQQEEIQQAQEAGGGVLNMQQVETLLARLTLVENKVAMMDTEMRPPSHPTAGHPPSGRQGRPNGALVQAVMNGNCEPHHKPPPTIAWSPPDLSPGPPTAASSVPVTAETVGAAPSTSTPLQPEPTKQSAPISYPATSPQQDPDPSSNDIEEKDLKSDQFTRISNMLKQTETLLNIQVDSPVKPVKEPS